MVEQNIGVPDFSKYITRRLTTLHIYRELLKESCRWLQSANKVVHHYEDVDAGERCHVCVLDKYRSSLQMRTNWTYFTSNQLPRNQWMAVHGAHLCCSR